MATDCSAQRLSSILPVTRDIKVLYKKEQTKGKGNVCGACTIPIDFMADTASSICTSSTSTSILPSSCQLATAVCMHIAPCYMDGKPVTVLRDTGCSGIVVKRSLVDDNSLTCSKQVCVLADGTTVESPVAKISIDTPYLKGEFDAWCMISPVYDLIIGNVTHARDPGNPDPTWQEVRAVETRQQVIDKRKSHSKLKVKDNMTEEARPDDIKKTQMEDTSLESIRNYAHSCNVLRRKNSEIIWLFKRGMVYRQFKSLKDTKVSYAHLIVHTSHREIVMRLAHEPIMLGHMGNQCTLDRVLSALYWLGITADVKRFCQSCDICQRTIQKGRVDKVPLQSMLLIDEPFKRVAVDLIGLFIPELNKVAGMC